MTRAQHRGEKQVTDVDVGTATVSPPMVSSGGCRAVVLACIDYRFVEPLRGFLGAYGLAGSFDLIAWPGGALALNTADRDAVLDAMALACELHDPGEAVLTVHRDCGRLGGSASFTGHHAELATLDTGLSMAGDVVAARFSHLWLRLVCLDVHGAVGLGGPSSQSRSVPDSGSF